MYKKFEFSLVVDGITDDDAETILEIITEIATLAGAEVGGGFHEIEDDQEEAAEDV